MAKRKTAKQVAASRRNLAKARAARRRRVAVGVGVLAVAGGVGAYHSAPRQQFTRGHLRKRARTRRETTARFGGNAREAIYSKRTIRKQDKSAAHRLYRNHGPAIRKGMKQKRSEARHLHKVYRRKSTVSPAGARRPLHTPKAITGRRTGSYV